MPIGRVTPPPDVQRTIRALQTVDKGLAKAWRQEAREQVAKPWAAELARQAPPGALGAAAGRSIRAGTGAGVVIYMGKGAWKPGFQPYFGIEWGMHHNKWHLYIRRNRSGTRRHFVKRRIGRWAPQWIPEHSYHFRRYWEEHEDRIRNRIVTLTNRFMEEHL